MPASGGDEALPCDAGSPVSGNTGNTNTVTLA